MPTIGFLGQHLGGGKVLEKTVWSENFFTPGNFFLNTAFLFEAMKKQASLRRVLGLWQTTLAGVGIIFGAGIYVLVGKAAAIAGAQVWLSFLVAALVAGITGLSYAELSSMYPKASAEYEYSKNAFGKRIGFLVGWLAIIAAIVSAATVALGFGGYLGALTGFPILWLAIGVIVACSYIVFRGIGISTDIAAVFTIVESLGLMAIIFIGAPHLGNPVLWDFSSFNPSSIFTAAALIFFAFIGFEDIVRMSEETKSPKKTIPQALVLAIIISSIVYVLVAASAVSVLGAEKLGASQAPLADVAAQSYGANAFFALAIIALFSTFNTILLILLSASRLVYGIGKDKELPEVVSYIYPKTGTPLYAILIVMVLAAFLAALGDITLVANATDFLLFLIFIVINASVIVLRYKEPHCERNFCVPGSVKQFPILPALGIGASALLASHISMDIAILMIAMVFAGLLYFEWHSRRMVRNFQAKPSPVSKQSIRPKRKRTSRVKRA